MVGLATIVFSCLLLFAIGFQIALALGAPWGELAMAGRFPGRFPPKMRVAAVVQALFLAFVGLIVLARGGVLLPALYDLSRALVWGVVALFAVSLAMNLITPSRRERNLWSPVVAVLLVCALFIARS